MKLYKLTDVNNQTRYNTIWGPNVSNNVRGEGKELCTEDVLHAYKHPLFASFFQAYHCPSYTKLWEAEGDIVVDDGTKVGVKKLTTLKEIALPEITTEQKIKIGILCAKEVFKDEGWNKWADKWLSGEDRRECSARDAENAAVTAYTAVIVNLKEGINNAILSYPCWAAAFTARAVVDDCNVNYTEHKPEHKQAAYSRFSCNISYVVENVSKTPNIDILSIIEKVISETV